MAQAVPPEGDVASATRPCLCAACLRSERPDSYFSVCLLLCLRFFIFLFQLSSATAAPQCAPCLPPHIPPACPNPPPPSIHPPSPPCPGASPDVPCEPLAAAGAAAPPPPPPWAHAWPHRAVTSAAGAGGRGEQGGLSPSRSPPILSASPSPLPPPGPPARRQVGAGRCHDRFGKADGRCGEDVWGVATGQTPAACRLTYRRRRGTRRSWERTGAAAAAVGGRPGVRQLPWPSGPKSGGGGRRSDSPRRSRRPSLGSPPAGTSAASPLPSPTGRLPAQAARREGHLWTKHNAGGRRRGLPLTHVTGIQPALSARCGARGAGGTPRVPPLPPCHPHAFRSCGHPPGPSPSRFGSRIGLAVPGGAGRTGRWEALCYCLTDGVQSDACHLRGTVAAS